MGRVVLVTGVCRDIGGRFARRLADDPAVDRVVGVDVVPPRVDLGDVRFVRADIRNPVIAEAIAVDDVDTVVHLGVTATAGGAGGHPSLKEVNIIETLQLLAACQRAPGVQHLVVKSSSRVYGSSPKDPAMFSEDMAARRLPRSGLAKESVDVEAYVRGFRRRRPDVQVTMLRCANLLGPLIESSLTRYFSLPVIPTVLGFDPRLQFCHEEDALAALHHSTMHGVDGTFNLAGDGVLFLSQAVRRLGRPSIAVPSALLGAVGSVLRAVRSAELSSEQRAFLTYGRGLDTRLIRQRLGFEPSATTAEAFTAFVERLGPGLLSCDRIQPLERQSTTVVSKVVR